MARRNDEQGEPHTLALTFGHAGLAYAQPAEGAPADLAGGPDSFALGSAADFLSADSEVAFLRAAIATSPPTAQSHIHQLSPQPATPLSPQAAQELQQSVGYPQIFEAVHLFDNPHLWLSELDPPAYVRRWLLDGYSEFFPRPVQYVWKPNHSSTDAHTPFVTTQVQELLSTQAVEDITPLQFDPHQCAAVLPLTVADSGHRKTRLCWNGRHVNASLDTPTFKMEHAPKAASILKPGDWVFTIDMKSGYQQIPLNLEECSLH